MYLVNEWMNGNNPGRNVNKQKPKNKIKKTKGEKFHHNSLGQKMSSQKLIIHNWRQVQNCWF